MNKKLESFKFSYEAYCTTWVSSFYSILSLVLWVAFGMISERKSTHYLATIHYYKFKCWYSDHRVDMHMGHVYETEKA